MRLLIDTQSLLWWLGPKERLSRKILATIGDPVTEVFVSTASLWEIAIKVALGKLSFPIDRAETILTEEGFLNLPILAPHAVAAGALPRYHGDPFDRMIIAQAQREGLIIVTADHQFSRYDVPILE